MEQRVDVLLVGTGVDAFSLRQPMRRIPLGDGRFRDITDFAEPFCWNVD